MKSWKNDFQTPITFLQVHGSLGEKSPAHTYETEGEDDTSSSSEITGGTQTPPSTNRLGLGSENHSMKSQTPLSIKSEHSSSTTAHTRSPSAATMVQSPYSGSHNTFSCMPSTPPYGNSPNLPVPPPGSAHFNHPNPHALLYQHHHHSSNEWYQAAAVAAASSPTDPMSHLNHFSHHQHHLIHHTTAYWNYQMPDNSSWPLDESAVQVSINL